MTKVYDSHIEEGIIVSNAKIFNGECLVVSIGSRLETDLQVGDKVLVAEGAGAIIKREGEEYLVCVSQNILTVL